VPSSKSAIGKEAQMFSVQRRISAEREDILMPTSKLHEHPKVKGKWPPEWYSKHPIASHNKASPQGEQGTLKDVKRYWHGPSGHLTLVVEYGGEQYLGQIQLDDAVFCQDLLNTLTNCVGNSIRDVGNIDIGF
jgi:hypothetical protein